VSRVASLNFNRHTQYILFSFYFFCPSLCGCWIICFEVYLSPIWQECMLGLLSSKTVIYVTHQVEFLPAADLILASHSNLASFQLVSL
jgi:hypothetical protein